MEILLIEPNAALCEAVRLRLCDEGYAPVTASNGTDALKLLDSPRFESVLLDWQLPDMPGVDVLREMRTRVLDTPVMILSSRGSVADRVLALDSGADDYLLKPFHMDECMARVRRMVRTYRRRTPPSAGDGLHCIADLTVDRSIMMENLKTMQAWFEAETLADETVGALTYDASRCLQCGCCLEVCPNFYAGGTFSGAAAAVPAAGLLSALPQPQQRTFFQ